jgi:hypothetical protein
MTTADGGRNKAPAFLVVEHTRNILYAHKRKRRQMQTKGSAMLKAIREKVFGTEEEILLMWEVAGAMYALVYIALTDDCDGTEESLLDEMLRFFCMIFSLLTVALFLFGQLMLRIG